MSNIKAALTRAHIAAVIATIDADFTVSRKRANAETELTTMLADHGLELTGDEPAADAMVEAFEFGDIRAWLVTPSEPEAPAQTPEASSAPRSQAAGLSGPSTKGMNFTDELVIRKLVERNPKRAGSKSHERFGLIVEGMTIGEYKKACVDAGHTKAAATADIRWDVEHAWITFDFLTAMSEASEASDEEAPDTEAPDVEAPDAEASDPLRTEGTLEENAIAAE
jgi:hypothetical protein